MGYNNILFKVVETTVGTDNRIHGNTTAGITHFRDRPFNIFTLEILRRPDDLVPHCFLFTPNDTDTASLAFFGNYISFHFLGIFRLTHLNSIKGAFFNAILTTDTKVFVNYNLESIGFHEVQSVSLGIGVQHLAGSGISISMMVPAILWILTTPGMRQAT